MNNGALSRNGGAGTDTYFERTDAANVTITNTTIVGMGATPTSSETIGTGNDTLEGLARNDTLLGGADNDLLPGGDAADTLLGEAGADTLYGATSTTTDLYTDTLVGGGNGVVTYRLMSEQTP